MRTVELETWEDFKKQVAVLRANSIATKATSGGMHISHPCFRGHASHLWKLDTTLERAGRHNMSLLEYGHLMARIGPEINTLANRNFIVPSPQETWEWLDQIDKESYFPPVSPKGYDFMVYLRHHGFPSPLLDWTDSEFVAAYFAFIDASERIDSKVAIYAFIEYANGMKVTSPTSPAVVGTGPYVKAHPRHFSQQARYTYCRKYDDDGRWKYVSHERAFHGSPTSETERQDVLVQFVLPVGERKVVLDELRRYNLTPYSLFQTEDSLMKTMAMKELLHASTP